ncbi:MAG: P-type DNA transfer ATPase VirB11 [Alcaligenes aquatilis]
MNQLLDPGFATRAELQPLEPFLNDAAITELAIVRPESVFVRQRGTWQEHPCPALTLSNLKGLVLSLAVYNGLDLTPIMVVRLPDGERGQVVQAPACPDGTFIINIRKHTRLVKTLEELEADGAFDNVRDSLDLLDEQGLTPIDKRLLELKQQRKFTQFLHEAVQARYNIIVAGPTNSGKTTFARSLIERVPVNERLITIEDVHELLLPNHRNVVNLFYGKGQGRVSATECVEACMRLSPDRIFLAELRGSEAWEYMTALNTGHPGSVTTIHSNSSLETIDRVIALIKQSPTGGQLDLETIRMSLRNTINVVAFYKNFELQEVFFDPRNRRPGL